MDYNFREIEKKWQDHWKATNAYKVDNDYTKPKCYVLDMFPYPSGAGLHVGHPLGYIASDIYARYKRLKGFNVLHPMGYDAFGLPAEQYAIEHDVHPAVSTADNITNFRKQLDNIGFSYDWDRSVNTSNPNYYKWTQWIFLELFNSFYNKEKSKAEKIEVLIKAFEDHGSQLSIVNCLWSFTAAEWNNFDEVKQKEILMNHRLAFCGVGEVNWCEALGTVLANDEVVNGVSERGGHPVEKKKLRQWYLRITEYADRLLEGLQTVDFSDAMKEMQSNWIGKSVGAEISFVIRTTGDRQETTDKGQTTTDDRQQPTDDGQMTKDDSPSFIVHRPSSLTVYTTRPDTIFGVDFMVVAPELDLINEITTPEQKEAVENYLTYVKSRSDIERMAEKKITGCFTGAYAINPFNQKQIPIWISEYVLAGYGTGAIMAVPCGDERDFKFAKHFNIPITNIIGDAFNGEEANATKEAPYTNSDFLNGMIYKEASATVIEKLEAMGAGKRKVNFRMRDAAFSRQRYWGEPFPIVWDGETAYDLPQDILPLELPHLGEIKPGENAQGPLANSKEWMEPVFLDLTPNPSPLERGEESTSPPTPLPWRGEQNPGYIKSNVEQWKYTIGNAKKNRKEPTEAENLIWQNVRDRKINNLKFRRQHPIAGFIPDFVCLEKSIIIEIDGGYHNEEEQIKFDKAREEWLKEYGFTMLRFTNEEVINNVSSVLQKIKVFVPNPSSSESLGNEGSDSPLPWRGAGSEVLQGIRETSTMPGYAGSSWYFLRYMDPHNNDTFCDKKISDYWNQVDVYVGGTEHAVGHLLYSRMWTKALYDLGHIGYDEPFKKLLNQGMITAVGTYVRALNFKQKNNTTCHLYGNPKDVKEFQITQNDFGDQFIEDDYSKDSFLFRLPYISEFLNPENKITRVNFRKYFNEIGLKHWVVSEDGFLWVKKDNNSENDFFTVDLIAEKMSKSKYNTVNPDDLVAKYGADTFRMYEMFLGPVEMSKPWDTKGIEGVHRFIKKLWRLFYKEDSNPSPKERGRGEVLWNEEKATQAELKVLHKTIKKIEEDTEKFSYNTAVSAFMIAVNELTELKCHKKEILAPLLVLMHPYAPHFTTELYNELYPNSKTLPFGEGENGVVAFPKFDASLLVESSKEYPISINGKMRTTMNFSVEAAQADIEKNVLENEIVQKWLEGKEPKKIIFVKNKMVNVVV
jgi:leucyl-tRNA synthetase